MKSYNPNTVKKSVLLIVICLLVGVVLLTGCNSPNQKMENVEVNWEYQADTNQHQGKAYQQII